MRKYVDIYKETELVYNNMTLKFLRFKDRNDKKWVRYSVHIRKNKYCRWEDVVFFEDEAGLKKAGYTFPSEENFALIIQGIANALGAPTDTIIHDLEKVNYSSEVL